MSSKRPPKLPKLLDRKIYKTGQTRGADDDQIFQNRVSRASTVLIPLSVYLEFDQFQEYEFENGFIVLLRPREYFEEWQSRGLNNIGLSLGGNALIFYERRADWNRWTPNTHGLTLPTSRQTPLGGEYVARVANTNG